MDVSKNKDNIKNKVFFKSSKQMTEIKDNSIDCIITSPPYFNIKDYSKNGKQNMKHSQINNQDISNVNQYNNYLKEILKVWKECERVLRPNGKLCINVPLMPMLKSKYSTHYNRDILDLQSDIQTSIKKNTDLHLLDLYIWNRTNSTKKIMFGSYPYPNNFYNQNIVEFIIIFVKDGKRKNISKEIKEKSKLTKYEWINYTKQIWNIPIPNKKDLAFGQHSAIMPEEIPKRLIKMFSFEGDVILDPFSGSGTTLKVAKSLNRNYVGYELYNEYSKIIDKKLNLLNKNNHQTKNKFLNKIIQKDIIKGLENIPNNSVDLIVADPPYNINVDDWDVFENEFEYQIFTKKWILKSIEKLKENGSLYLFNNAYNSSWISEFLKDSGLEFKNSIIWYKKDGFSPSKTKYVNNQETILFFTKGDNYTFNNENVRVPYESKDRILAAQLNGILKNGKRWFPNPNGKMCTDVWEFASERHINKKNGKTSKTFHPTMKPEKLIERIILASSNENNIVLDLFSGSGTTAYVSIKNNRNFISIEKSKKYVDFIKERIKNV